jgi:hypothetical protein
MNEFFFYEQQKLSTSQNDTTMAAASIPGSSTTGKSYVYIDHEKTTTLKEIAKERLQQHSRRTEA